MRLVWMNRSIVHHAFEGRCHMRDVLMAVSYSWKWARQFPHPVVRSSGECIQCHSSYHLHLHVASFVTSRCPFHQLENFERSSYWTVRMHFPNKGQGISFFFHEDEKKLPTTAGLLRHRLSKDKYRIQKINGNKRSDYCWYRQRINEK